MKKLTRFLSSLATAYSLQPVLLVLLISAPLGARGQQQTTAAVALAHFHHVHLNTTDPAAAILFYTSKFKARKQLAKGTRFATPITDIRDLVGGNRPFFYAYVDGPDHVLIELNTARHHNFGHVHLFSADPPAAGAWYAKELGVRSFPQTEKRVYRGVQIAPAAFVTADHVSMIIYPVEYRGGTIVPTRGRAVDHLGFSVDDLDAALARLRHDGVKVTAEPRSSVDGKVRFAFIEGPDQVALELIEDSTPRPPPVED
jgi:catechol 2,3-dioxygenase-like lactoylglutathione lyase family enzyme